jgi:hypothetical protein
MIDFTTTYSSVSKRRTDQRAQADPDPLQPGLRGGVLRQPQPGRRDPHHRHRQEEEQQQLSCLKGLSHEIDMTFEDMHGQF